VTKITAFKAHETAIAMESFVTVLDGVTHYVHEGERLTGAHPAVRLHGEMFFKRDGELRVYRVPEPPDPPPQAPPVPPKMLRVLKHFSTGDRELAGPWGPERIKFTLLEGQEIRADWRPLEVLSRAERRDVLEEIVDV
jgi:hypothetical protein